MTTQPLVSAAL
jgi:membrane protein DedA with SNARE-associated domain